MAAREAQRVRFVKEYGNWAGYRFRRYETSDGRAAEIRVRTGRDGLSGHGLHELTSAEAKAEAAATLAGAPQQRWHWACGERHCGEARATESCIPVAPPCPVHGDAMRPRRGVPR